MKTFSFNLINSLNISPATCMEWIKDSFSKKGQALLPPKISIHPQGDDFFNTMPVILPYEKEKQYYGVKVVHRIANATPSIGGDILLYDAKTGELLAMMDADWITMMRTGAVAAFATKLFKKSNAHYYGFSGLGNTARATALCLLESEPNIPHKFLLLRYKDQAEKFIERFSKYPNVTFDIVNDVQDLISSSDVLYHCVTASPNLVCENDEVYKEGLLLVPVHTRGFQNCDLFFDKVFADDTGHVKGFKYFDKFRYFAELSDVLTGKDKGRTSDKERIISYNIGLGLHDIVFASRIYEQFKDKANNINIEKPNVKFWV